MDGTDLLCKTHSMRRKLPAVCGSSAHTPRHTHVLSSHNVRVMIQERTDWNQSLWETPLHVYLPLTHALSPQANIMLTQTHNTTRIDRSTHTNTSARTNTLGIAGQVTPVGYSLHPNPHPCTSNARTLDAHLRPTHAPSQQVTSNKRKGQCLNVSSQSLCVISIPLHAYPHPHSQHPHPPNPYTHTSYLHTHLHCR